MSQPCAVGDLQHALPCKAAEQDAASRHGHMAVGSLLRQHHRVHSQATNCKTRQSQRKACHNWYAARLRMHSLLQQNVCLIVHNYKRVVCLQLHSPKNTLEGPQGRPFRSGNRYSTSCILGILRFIVCFTASGSNCLPEVCQHLTNKPIISNNSGIDRHTRTQARRQTCARCHMRLVPTVADPAPNKSLRRKELLAAKIRKGAAGTAGTVRHA